MTAPGPKSEVNKMAAQIESGFTAPQLGTFLKIGSSIFASVVALFLGSLTWIAIGQLEETDKLSERVGGVEKDLIEVKTNMRHIQSASDKVESKLDELDRLIRERLPRPGE